MRQTITAPTAPAAALPPGIFRQWFHSREESRGEILVYRPPTFIFPPGPPRHGFEISPDGVFSDFSPTPGGGLLRLNGRWTQPDADTVAASFAEIGRDGYSLVIVALDEGAAGGATLRVKRRAGRHQWPSDRARLDAYLALPSAAVARRIDYAQADVEVLESFPPQFRLTISGVKPFVNMAVDVQPQIYLERPDYWAIEVTGRLRGFDLPGQVPFSLTVSIDGTIGSKGVELRGATKRQRIELPSDEIPPEA